MRPLSPEEAELWSRVAAAIKPLSREPISSPERGGGSRRLTEGAHVSAARTWAPSTIHSSVNGPPPRFGEDLNARTLDSTWDRRLRSGAVQPDVTLDLHGLNLDRAWT